jgi:hypothetical protein
MTIRIPQFKKIGKIIVEYKGANVNAFYTSSIIEKVTFHSQLKINIFKEDLVLEFSLQDGTKIRFCIKNKNIYLQFEKDWLFFDESKFIKCEILKDDDSIYFLGQFSFTKPISQNFVANETYSFTVIFDKNKAIIDELKLAKLI